MEPLQIQYISGQDNSFSYISIVAMGAQKVKKIFLSLNLHSAWHSLIILLKIGNVDNATSNIYLDRSLDTKTNCCLILFILLILPSRIVRAAYKSLQSCDFVN